MTTLGALAALALALPGSAFAQTGTISATADVASVMTLENTNPINFGEITPGNNTTIGINDAPASGGSAGSGYAEFQTNDNWAVTVTPDAVLTNGTADDDLSVSWTCGESDTTTSGTAVAFTCTDGTDGTVTAQETVVIWLGGTVTVPGTAMAGTYTGDVEITMAQN